jgi:hypothetical protein
MLVSVNTQQNRFLSKTWRPSLVGNPLSSLQYISQSNKNLTLNNVLAGVFKDDLGICLDTIYVVIDSITINFDHLFNEPSSELLQKLCCLDSRDSFSRFNVNKLLTIERFIMDIIINMSIYKIILSYSLFI